MKEDIAEIGEHLAHTVDYTDNYFHLMPHERKTVVIAWEEEDARGVDVQLQLEGMNVPTAHIPFVR